MVTDARLIEVIRRTPGPLPWYADALPTLQVRGRPLQWAECDDSRRPRISYRLVDPNQPQRSFMDVAMYARLFPIPPGLLGIWYPVDDGLRVCALDPDALEAIELDAVGPDDHATKTILPQRGFRCRAALLGEFLVSMNNEPSNQPINLPAAFSGMRDLVMVGGYSMAREAACAAIFEIREGSASGSRRLCVFPQKWFTKDDYDLGYQWITRVARHPDGTRFIGDGIRLPGRIDFRQPGLFVTTDTGCELERWIPLSTD